MKQLVDRFPQGVVQIPPSKSEAHRVLICAALAQGETAGRSPDPILTEWVAPGLKTKGDGSSVFGLPKTDEPSPFVFVTELGLSEDIRATAAGIHTIVANGEKGGTVDCGESGSTLRFLIPVAAMTGGEWTFKGRGRLLDRPMGIFADLFRSHGAHYEQTPAGITVRGPLSAGVYELPGDVSSQFVSGLLLALPLAGAPLSLPRRQRSLRSLLRPLRSLRCRFFQYRLKSVEKTRESHSEIILTSPLESVGYVDLTIKTMRSYGITVREIRGAVTGWQISAGQRYFLPVAGDEHVCGRDWSQAAFFLCAGALGCDVSVAGLDRESVQGDRRVAEILERMGARVAWRAGLVQAYPPTRSTPFRTAYHAADGAQDASSNRAQGESPDVLPNGDFDCTALHGVVIDARDIPDIVPPLAALACYAVGETRFVNAGRLRIKESDRLAALAEELGKLGADICETPDGLIIQGTGGAKLRGCEVQAHGDHRIAMALAVAAIGCETPVVIEGAESVAKSYPAFWDDFLKKRAE